MYIYTSASKDPKFVQIYKSIVRIAMKEVSPKMRLYLKTGRDPGARFGLPLPLKDAVVCTVYHPEVTAAETAIMGLCVGKRVVANFGMAILDFRSNEQKKLLVSECALPNFFPLSKSFYLMGEAEVAGINWELVKAHAARVCRSKLDIQVT